MLKKSAHSSALFVNKKEYKRANKKLYRIELYSKIKLIFQDT